MGGFFGAVSRNDVINEVFYGTDYHSHLGTRRGGMAAYDKELGLQRDIHNIQNSPFRTKFEKVFDEMYGNAAIGCISDFEPQPLLFRSKIGTYALAFIGHIENSEELIDDYLSESGHYFDSMTGGKINSVQLLAALINQKDNYVDGIKFAQSVIKGSATILILTNKGTLIAARDSLGRLPIHTGKSDEGYCVATESFSYQKLGFEDYKELGPGEIVELSVAQRIWGLIVEVINVIAEFVSCDQFELIQNVIHKNNQIKAVKEAFDVIETAKNAA